MLYLIRHADASHGVPDEQRPLSPLGRAQVGRLTGFLHRTATFRPAEIWHSPLLRARETAAGLHQGLGLGIPLRQMDGLTPEDDPEAMVSRLEAFPRPLALVSHEPFLGQLASRLVAGEAAPTRFLMKTSGVLALTPAGSHWVACWHLDPDLLA